MGKFTQSLWEAARNLASDVVQTANDVLNKTGINDVLSAAASIPQAIIGNTNITDLSMLKSTHAIAAPTNQNINQTPTTSQFLNAANAAYTLAGSPEGMKPFLQNGKQLAITNVASAMSAKVWVTDNKQLVIAFQGTTGGDNIFLNPTVAATGVASDIQVWNQTVSQAQKDALSFTRYVVDQAEKQGINTNNIFVTGHSLGGIEASYVAQQTGLGGMAFESTGVPSSSTAVGNGQNFVSVVTHGDPVGNYASDTQEGMSFVTAMPPGAKGEFDHYGKVFMVGAEEDSTALNAKLSGWNSNSFANMSSLINIVPDFLKYHLPGTQAADMGISLNPHSLTADAIVTAHGPVLPVGNDTLGNFFATDTHQNNYFAAAA